MADRKKRYYDKLISQARCARCGKENTNAVSNYCDECRRYMREYQKFLRERNARDKAEALAAKQPKKKPKAKPATKPKPRSKKRAA